ncbi:MAG TPA: lytic transglycosylase F, partial [Microbulbifer sp.]
MPPGLRLSTCLALLCAQLLAGGCEREAGKPSSPNQPAEQLSQRDDTGASQQAPRDDAAVDNASASDESDDQQPQQKYTGHPAASDELRPEAEWAPDTTGEYPIGAYNNYIEKGDLDAIRRRGKLRILVDIANTDSLHRAATQQDIEIELAK